MSFIHLMICVLFRPGDFPGRQSGYRGICVVWQNKGWDLVIKQNLISNFIIGIFLLCVI